MKADQKRERINVRRPSRMQGSWTRFGMGVLAGYLLSYILMSLLGRQIVANHGGSDWRREWCPRFLVEDYMAFSGRTRTTLTPLGMLYWPCICVDHLLWHRTRAENLSGVSESGQTTGEGSRGNGLYYGDSARVGDLKGAVLYFMRNERWQDAEVAMRAIVDSNKKHGDMKALVNNYCVLGLTLKMQLKHEQELTAYEQELRLARALSAFDPASECDAWLGMASAQVAMGRVAAARKCMEQARQVAQRSNLQQELGAIKEAMQSIEGLGPQPFD